jgi:hypothetical protein
MNWFYYLKIKSIAMQIARIIQAVILMTIIALAASCASTKEYVNKVFPAKQAIPHPVVNKTKNPRFLEINKEETDSVDWVRSTISSNGDTIVNSADEVLTKPLANYSTIDTINNFPSKKDTAPLVKANKLGTVRNKKTRD